MEIKSIFKKAFAPVLGLFLVFSLLFTPINTSAVPQSSLENTTQTTAPTTTETTQTTAPTAENAQNTTPATTTTDTTQTTTDTTQTTTTTDSSTTSETEKSTCYDNVGGLGWLICPTTGLLADIIDNLYSGIESYLKISPLSTDTSSPIYLIWQYARDITNVVFVIFLLVIVFSQLTGVGISNYGIKKTLPRIIVAAILVNISYFICTLAVDLSNIIGVAIKNFLMGIAETAAGGTEVPTAINFGDVFAGLIAGGTIAGIAIGLTGGLSHLLWMFIGTALAGTISIFIGFLTVALRQAVVAVLVMISPLAFVCYLLPNTEKWFDKWKSTLTSMLIFYPMFAGLFGAAQLAGWAITASAGDNAFFVILGLAVRVLPLFMAAKLLKMSGTVLGQVSAAFTKWTDPAVRGARKWSAEQGEMHKQRYIANSFMPSASLRRYMDTRKRLRDIDTKNNLEARASLAEAGAQKIIGTGGEDYDPGNPNAVIRTTAYARDAKNAQNLALEAQVAALDTQHILGHYDEFHGGTFRDQQLAAQSGHNFMEFSRAESAAIADNYADIDWLMGKYDAITHLGPGNYAYDHYVTGAAGALGSSGEALVLGQIIGKAAANEAKRRQSLALVYAKYGFPKGEVRDAVVGYYTNDDGLATFAPDKYGNRELVRINEKGELDPNGRPEIGPGEFLKYHPEVLQGYKKYEEVPDGKGGVKKRLYFDVKDQEGKYVTRVFRDDGPSMKETLAGWDMPIQDPIDGLYGILSGINPGDIKVDGLEGVGLAKLSTTLGRALNASKYSDKATFASPMYATSVTNRYIKDFCHQNIERFDNIAKTAKPSKFNTQDFAELQQLHRLLDPKNWKSMIFNEESMRTRRNVNGKYLEGTRILFDDSGNIQRDKNGKIMTVTVSPDEATPEELQNTIIVKLINPAASKIATMMTRITPQTLDNQKPGVAEEWTGVYDDLKLIRGKLGLDTANPQLRDEEFIKKYPLLANPLAEQTKSDLLIKSREIRHDLTGGASSLPGGGPINNTGGNPLGGPTVVRDKNSVNVVHGNNYGSVGGNGTNRVVNNPLAAGAPASGQTYHNRHAHTLEELDQMIAHADQARAARGNAQPTMTPEQQAAEAALWRKIDAEFEEEYPTDRFLAGDLDPSENPNIQVRINNIANLVYDGEDFYRGAMGVLTDAYTTSGDEALAGIIDDFGTFHDTHFGSTTEQYQEHLDDLLSGYIY